MIIELKIDPDNSPHRVAMYLGNVVYGDPGYHYDSDTKCYRIGTLNDVSLWPHGGNWRVVERYGRTDLLARVLNRWGGVEVISVDGKEWKP